MGRRRRERWQPTTSDYAAVISEQNPWHRTGVVPEAWAFRSERAMSRQLWRRIMIDRPRRFQLVVGPRRVGKTTCLYQTVRHLLAEGNVPRERIWWMRLDHPLLMRQNLGQLVEAIPEVRSSSEPTYLFLDELNYEENWDLWLKTFYDESWPVRIVGSSSSAAALRHRRAESGVGRWEEQFLPPCLFSEFLQLMGWSATLPRGETLRDTLWACGEDEPTFEGLPEKRRRYLITGGFPELLLSRDCVEADEETVLLQSQRVLRADAVQTAIYKDIPQAYGVDNPLLLERLLYALAGQIGGILSPTSICGGLEGMSQPTFDRYLSYLERAFLVFTLPNYSGKESSVQRRGRKLYFVDTAVRNAALQRGLAPLRDGAEMGWLVENTVASQLYALSQQTQIRLYHWREKDAEVDFVYDHPEHPLAFEIGLGPNHSCLGLIRLMDRYPKFRGGCFLVTPEAPIRMPPSGPVPGIGSFPLDLFLLVVSIQAERELERNLGVLT